MDPLAAGNADVYIAITENNLSNAVTRGENKGHKLSHVAVVRKLTLLGHTTAKSSFNASPTVRLSKDWKRADLKFLVFAQNSKSRNVVALGSYDGGPSRW